MAFPVMKPVSGGEANAVVANAQVQHARGINALFEIDFFDDAPTNTVPAVPSSNAYPTFAILDPTGVQVINGVGTPGSVPGRWQTNWFVSQTAALSTKESKYRIVWNMVTQTARQLQQTVPFDVIELRTPDTLADLRAHAYMTYVGQSERMVLRLPKRPDSISLVAYQAMNMTTPVPNATPAFGGSFSSGTIQEVQEQNLYCYLFDTPALTGLGEYQIVWNYRMTPTSPSDVTVQKLFVPPQVVWSLIPSLRVLIDKLQKKSGTIQAYTDADIYEYYLRGLGYLNSTTPITNWDLTTFPYNPATTKSLVLAAALWAMQAQHLLSGELAFSFCLDEESLVRTDRGLVMAKNLVEPIDPNHLAGIALKSKVGDDFLKAVFANTLLHSGKRTAKEIVEISGLDLNPLSLTSRLVTLGLNAYYERDHGGLWDMGACLAHVAKLYRLPWLLGEQTGPVKRDSLHSVMSFKDAKSPLFVWDMGYKETLKLKTECGLTEIATPNHGFLVLNTETLAPEWKKLSDIEIGDYIAVDAEGEEDKDWEVKLPHVSITTPTQKDYGYTLPDVMTPELARVFGYLVAEGTVNTDRSVIFSNTDHVLLDQFRADATAAFGAGPHFEYVTEQAGKEQQVREGEKFISHKDLTHVHYDGVRLRRHLAACGLGYESAKEKSIPWSILQAPLHLVAEFLKAYFDGDGCFALIDREEYAASEHVIFCSYSEKFRNQLMAVLLRFGILGRDNGFDRVTVAGPDAVTYANRIGFLHKKGVIKEDRLRQVGPRTALPQEMFATLRHVTELVPNVRRGWWTNPETGETERLSVGWDHSGKGCTTYTGKENLRRWYNDRKDVLKKVGANDLLAAVEFHLERDVRWQRVVSIEDAGVRRVLDPSLPDLNGHVLDHAFTAQGLVNHNSGQTVTLDVDQTGVYSEVISRINEDLFGTGPASWKGTKVNYIRAVTPIAHVANRIMGKYAYNRFTYKVQSGFIGSDSQPLMNVLPGPGVNSGFTLTDALVYLNLV